MPTSNVQLGCGEKPETQQKSSWVGLPMRTRKMHRMTFSSVALSLTRRSRGESGGERPEESAEKVRQVIVKNVKPAPDALTQESA